MQRKKTKKRKNIPALDTFGGRLRKSRTDRGLGQCKLAVMLGYNNNGPISTMENNKTSPDLHTLARISECLDVDLHWLITGEPPRADRNLEDDYAKLLGRFAKYMAKAMVGLFEAREYWQDRLTELQEANAAGNNIDDDVIAEHEAELEQVQESLSAFLTEQPWVQKALERLGSAKSPHP